MSRPAPAGLLIYGAALVASVAGAVVAVSDAGGGVAIATVNIGLDIFF